VNLEEALEVQIGNLLTILHAEELGELSIRDDAALEVRIKAVVGLDVGGHELGHISLRALGLSRETHERGKLISDWAELEECIVGATSLPRLLLLGGHGSGIRAAALLRITSLTLECLGSLNSLVDSCADTRADIRAESLESLLESREDSIGRTGLSGSNFSGSGCRGRSRNRYSYLSLGSSLAGLCGGRSDRCSLNNRGSGGLGLLISRHVYITSRLNRWHF
jgi:hypothetical protein